MSLRFWKDKSLSENERRRLLVETCQRVFGSEEGKIVLNMLLTDLCFFKPLNTKTDKALNNYAKFLIRGRLGVTDEKAITDFIAETAVSAGGKQ